MSFWKATQGVRAGALIALAFCLTASAQSYRGNLKDILKRLEEDSDHFTKSLDYDLDHGPLNGTAKEDEINRYVHEFEEATGFAAKVQIPPTAVGGSFSSSLQKSLEVLLEYHQRKLVDGLDPA